MTAINELDEKKELLKRADEVKRCTVIGLIVNAVLSALKIVAGFVGNSGAMIADGIHSVSDFATDIVVLAFVGVTARGIDHRYHYGHGKFETFATMIIAVVLMVVAIGLFWSSGENVLRSLSGEEIEAPSYIALVMAAVSIVTKEILYRYTAHVGDAVKSMALVANAWHHRSDAFSSVAALIGIAGAMFLAPQWRILDPLAAMAVSVFIAIVAWRLLMPSVRELLEVSLPDDEIHSIENEIRQVPGVMAFHHLRTRKNGNRCIIDMHIKVQPEITVVAAHDIASAVEYRLKERYHGAMVYVHIEPYKGETVNPQGKCID
ncbi:MAG TPA: cation transporter [Candidatus Avimuribaculum pullicola]|nr:cation transporter [Candidatus Avimuribaculum pullicola]